MAPAHDLPALAFQQIPNLTAASGEPLGPGWPKYPFLFPHNRVRPVALHLPYYGVQLQARLAYDAGLARSTLCRLVGGQSQASLPAALRILGALSRRMGSQLPLEEVFSLDGSYPTASACALCGCKGCLPPEAYGEDDRLKPEWRQARPGEWSLSPEPADSSVL